MAYGNEIMFGRIAVHNGIITTRQLEEYIELQRDRAGSKHIAQILMEEGLLNEAQARAILVTQRRNLHRERPGREGEEFKIARHLLKEGRLTPDDVDRARSIQEEMGSRGLFPSFTDILVQQGRASLSDVAEAQKEVGRRELWCAECGKKYRIVGYRPDRAVFCRKCGGKLAPRGGDNVVDPTSPRKAEEKEPVFETSLFAADDVSFEVFPEQAPPAGTREAEAEGESQLRVSATDGDIPGEMLDVALPSAMLAPPKMPKPGFRPRPGDVLGGCRLEKRIGVGGMGEIYKGRHLGLDREVAVKILSCGRMRQQPHLVQRFLSEARAAARLEHPNIVTVYDVNEQEGVHFIVMQFVDGMSIRDMLKEKGPFKVRESLPIIREAALALDYAHRQHMVHRDVKSQNIMLNEAGHVKLVDFGLTKDFSRDTSLTSDGMVVGTAQYMSPEQADGETVDGRSDLYSLGITWFEMLTGRLPFYADSPWAVLIKQQTEAAPDVREKRPDCPERVAGAISKLLEKDSGSRFQTGAELAEEVSSMEQELRRR